ncbi:uncharacterized protein E0L32_007201 [Thyridium curvatum]|uniref:Protein PBN1 n=1 Tax=Thyridium curvatum TaxID=1093900 RepID=A0A507AZ66_9PEZI|nr:uncharacterized protein E0L32_007201 [Thyridium curvatum]TPX12086.1 hypothetical protein E0L32_007201 [Thyridium curvatum]
MRQRVTFFQNPGSPVDPASLSITKQTLNGPEIHGIREDRATFALDELPGELRALLERYETLQIRWASKENHESLSSTALPASLGSHASSFQFYQPLSNLSHFVDYAKSELCAKADSLCPSLVENLDQASSLDISFDAAQHVFRATATWARKTLPLSVTAVPGHRTEVGILAADSPPNMDPSELGIAGHLTVLGQDSKPSATIFAFPSRHRHVEGASFSSRFTKPTGLHPTLQLRIDGPTQPPVSDADCSMHAYFTLPRAIFADRYQLSDPLFMASKNLTSLQYMSEPVDLEAPEYAVKLWGSAMLLELAPPVGKTAKSWTAEIPLHLRYLSPAQGGYADAELPYPAVFWACAAAPEGPDFANNPFDRTHLGYDALFDARTVFWHVDPEPTAASAASGTGHDPVSKIRVPVLDTDKAGWVNTGTAAVIALGFGWILWRLIAVYLRAGYGTARGADKAKKLQ